MDSLRIIFFIYFLALLPLGLNAQTRQYHGGVDSLNNIFWWEQPVSPGTTARIEKQLMQSDYLVLLNCDGSPFSEQTVKVPKTCSDFYLQNLKKIELDTLDKLYDQCIHDYYFKKPATGKVDTLYLEQEIENLKFPGVNPLESAYFITKIELYNDDFTSRIVSKYYTIEELKNECIIGEDFRRKSLEIWNNGKKDEIWKYYNKNGKLVRLIEYKKDQVIREENY